MSLEKEREFEQIIAKHIPEASLHYCVSLWLEHPFHFKITRERKTKSGDFRYSKKNGYTITVNNNLNPYAFLITYIHEFAHLLNWEEHKQRVDPHGVEWQNAFKELMLPLINDAVFPLPLIKEVARHFKKPKATTHSDKALFKALSEYDTASNVHLQYLENLTPETVFIFNDRVFQLVSFRRTRALCKEVNNNKQYLISKMAQVDTIPT